MRASLDLHHLGLASTTTNNGWNKIKIYISLIWKKTGCRQFWRSNSPEIRTYSPFNFALHLSIVDSWPKMDAEIPAIMSTLYTGKWEEIKDKGSFFCCLLLSWGDLHKFPSNNFCLHLTSQNLYCWETGKCDSISNWGSVSEEEKEHGCWEAMSRLCHGILSMYHLKHSSVCLNLASFKQYSRSSGSGSGRAACIRRTLPQVTIKLWGWTQKQPLEVTGGQPKVGS